MRVISHVLSLLLSLAALASAESSYSMSEDGIIEVEVSWAEAENSMNTSLVNEAYFLQQQSDAHRDLLANLIRESLEEELDEGEDLEEGAGGRRRRRRAFGRRRRKRGVFKKIGKGLKKGATATGKGIKKGATATGSGIKKGVAATAGAITSVGKAVTSSATEFGRLVKNGVVGAAFSVGEFTVDAAGAVANNVEDWGNQVAGAASSALQALVTAGRCLKNGPVKCIMDLAPKKLKRSGEVMKGAIKTLVQGNQAVMLKTMKLVGLVAKGIKCTKKKTLKYPTVSGKFPALSVKMKGLSVCSKISFDAKTVAKEIKELKEEILDSTLVTRIMNLGEKAANAVNGLLEVNASESTTTMATSRETLGTKCNDKVGSFEFGAGIEAQGPLPFVIGGALSVLINIGCKNGIVASNLRIGLNFGVSAGSETADGVFTLNWQRNYPDDVDEDWFWAVGHPKLQLAVMTTGLTDFIKAPKSFGFTGIGIDVSMKEMITSSGNPLAPAAAAGPLGAAGLIGIITGSALGGLIETSSATATELEQFPGNIGIGWDFSFILGKDL